MKWHVPEGHQRRNSLAGNKVAGFVGMTQVLKICVGIQNFIPLFVGFYWFTSVQEAARVFMTVNSSRKFRNRSGNDPSVWEVRVLVAIRFWLLSVAEELDGFTQKYWLERPWGAIAAAQSTVVMCIRESYKEGCAFCWCKPALCNSGLKSRKKLRIHFKTVMLCLLTTHIPSFSLFDFVKYLTWRFLRVCNMCNCPWKCKDDSWNEGNWSKTQ